MMTRLLPSLVVAALGAAIVALAGPQLSGGLQFGFMSQTPKFARINLSDSGDKWLLVIFDESGGTGSGYDFVNLLPQGFKGATLNAKAQGAKKFPAVFPPIKVADQVADAGVRKGAGQYLSTIAFVCSNASLFSAQLQYHVRANGVNWEYKANVPVFASEDDTKATAVSATLKPSLSLAVHPVVTGKTCAIGIVASAMPASCTANGAPPELSVVVKAATGTVVKRLTTSIDQFGTNAAGACICVVPVPRRGACAVEASIDLGPLGGPLKASARAELIPPQGTPSGTTTRTP